MSGDVIQFPGVGGTSGSGGDRVMVSLTRGEAECVEAMRRAGPVQECFNYLARTVIETSPDVAMLLASGYLQEKAKRYRRQHA